MMAKYDVALLTESRYENPTKKNDYISNILQEDRLLKAALEKQGLTVVRWDWARKDVDFGEASILLFRTTWDYFHRWEEFSQWLDDTQNRSRFINPIPTIRWNLDKHYLIDLSKKGVNIAPTQLIEKGSALSLKEAYTLFGITDIVLKPLVSGAARHTYKLNAGSIEAHEEIFRELIAKEGMMIQEFQHTVPVEGELSLMYFGDNFSHAVLKKAKKGDFRVQDDFGGKVYDHQATEEEIAFGQHAIRQVDPLPVYGRVDIFRDNDGKLALAELELIEPELWFRNHPPAADMLAAQLRKLLK